MAPNMIPVMKYMGKILLWTCAKAFLVRVLNIVKPARKKIDWAWFCLLVHFKNMDSIFFSTQVDERKSQCHTIHHAQFSTFSGS